MKASLLVTFGLVACCSFHSAAQNVGFTYQAVAVDESKAEGFGKDSRGDILVNQKLSIRFSILEGSEEGELKFQERHETSTDIFGIFRTVIGRGIYISGTDLKDLSWGEILYFLQVEIDFGEGFIMMGTEELLGVPYALSSGKQILILEDNTLSISKGNSVVLNDNNAANELNQNFSLNGTTLQISDAGGTKSVNLQPVLIPENSQDEIQQISTDGSPGNISITKGSSIQLNINDADADATNELQSILKSGTNVTLSNGGGTISVADNDNDSTNEIQDLQLNGSLLSITSNSTATPINLAPYLGNNLTEADVDGYVSNNGYLTSEMDGSVTNEVQDLQLSANILTITNNATATTIDLTPYLDHTAVTEQEVDAFVNNNGYLTAEVDGSVTNEIQNISTNGTAGNISIANGSTLNLNVNDADASPTNEIQDLQLNGSLLSITSNSTATPIDLAPYLANNLTEADVDGYVSNNGYLTNEIDGSITNEIQDLQLNANILTITNNATATAIDLTPYLDNTPVTEQQIDAFVNNNGYLTDEVDGSVINEIQNISTNGSAGNISIDNGSTLNLNVNDADASPTNEIQDLSLTGNTLSLTNNQVATNIDLEPYLDAAFSTTQSITSNAPGSYAADDFVFGSTQLDDGPVLGSNRMLFDKSKGAFRAGFASGGVWNDASRGMYSTAIGYNPQASGHSSVAIGSSFAFGAAAVSLGWRNEAHGDASFSVGEYTYASGNFSSTFGRRSRAYGNASSALGQYVYAQSFAETALGVYNSEYVASSLVTSNINDRLFVIGNGTTNDSRSDAFVMLKSGNTRLHGQLTIDADNVNGVGGSYSFPGQRGLNGQVLQTDANGIVNWTDIDASVTNEIQDLSLTNNTLTITGNGTATPIDLTAYLNDNALTEAEVDAFVNNNGFLTSEVDGSITNEIQDLDLTGNVLTITDNVAATNVDLAPYLDAAFETTANVTSNAPGNYATDDFVFGSPTLGFNGVLDNYSRFFFDKSKAAFRAGASTSTWNDVNIGNYSTAFGNGAIASGSESFAVGDFSTTASGSGSVAMGSDARATGGSSFAFGAGSRATGLSSLAFGTNAQSTNGGAVAIGQALTVSGLRAVAIGTNSFSSGHEAISLGVSNTASNVWSTAIGFHATASGERSVAIGNYSSAQGYCAMAFGSNASAGGVSSFAVNGIASGQGATAVAGLASGISSTALGLSEASGDYSSALGTNSVASGFASVTLGLGNRARSAGEVVTGYYATDDTPGSSSLFLDNDRLFVIGNGSDFFSRSNALVISKNGSTRLHGQLTIDADNVNGVGGSYSFPGQRGLNGQVLQTDANGIVSWSDIDVNVTNEIQDLSLTNNTLTITNNGTATPIDLSPYLNDNALTETEVDAFVNNNGFLTNEVDGSLTNEIQDLSLTNNTLTVTNNTTATAIDLAPYLDAAFSTNGIVTSNAPGDYASDDFVFGSPTLDSDGNASHRRRILFDKSKYAFRAGSVNASQWDEANRGFGSFATGINTTAFGALSFATGNSTSANATAASSFGIFSQATGDYSFVTGSNSVASGSGSVSMGETTIASGQYSFSLGRENLSSGNYSFALGRNSEAIAESAMAFGYEATASGQNSIALGYNLTSSGFASVAMGAWSSATSSYSTALGADAQATISGATAIGGIASGLNSVALKGTASGSGSISIGGLSRGLASLAIMGGTGTNATGAVAIKASANGPQSVAIGLFSQTHTNAVNGVAIGWGNTAENGSAVALGTQSTATGDGSATLGFGVLARSYGEVVVGTYNTDYVPSNGIGPLENGTFHFKPDDRIFTVGNGSLFNNRSDALVMFKNGNTRLHGRLTIDADNINGAGEQYTLPGQDGSANQVMVTDGNGIVNWANVDASTTNEIQDLSLTTNTLSITNNAAATSIDLTPYLDASFSTTSNVTSNNPGTIATDDFVFGSPQLNSDGDATHDTRLLFDKSNGAFRVGTANNTQWDETNRGANSVALGTGNVAPGMNSFAAGLSNLAYSESSVAIGTYNQAEGYNSVAIGRNVTTTGTHSMAFGFYSAARSFGETVLGLHATDVPAINSTGYDANDRLFTIGNGQAGNASDALTILKNGNATLNGSLLVTGVFTNPSDNRLKKEITPLANSLSKISLLKGYHYQWNSKKPQDTVALQTGLIAQEVEKIFPELVETNADGYKAVNYIGIVPHLLEAIKELKAENELLKKENTNLRTTTDQKSSELEARLNAIEKILNSDLLPAKSVSSN